MVQTRATAPPGRVYESRKPPRQKKLRNIMDQPQVVRRRTRASPIPVLRQETITQMVDVYQDFDNKNEIPEEEEADEEDAEREQQKKKRKRRRTVRYLPSDDEDEDEDYAEREGQKKRTKRRRTLGDLPANRAPISLPRSEQSTLTQIGFVGNLSDAEEEEEEAQEMADGEREEHIKREESIPIFEDKTAEPARPRRRGRPRKIPSRPDETHDESGGHATIEEAADEDNELDARARPQERLRNTRSRSDQKDEEPGGHASIEEAEGEDNALDENIGDPKDHRTSDGSPELGTVLELRDSQDVEDYSDEDDLRVTVRRKRRNTGLEEKEIRDSEEELDTDEDVEGEIEQNNSDEGRQRSLECDHLETEQNEKGNKNGSDQEQSLESNHLEPEPKEKENGSNQGRQQSVEFDHPSGSLPHSTEIQAQVQVQSSISPVKTPRKYPDNHEIPDSDAESDLSSPQKITPPKPKSPFTIPIQSTPSRGTSRPPRLAESQTPSRRKSTPVPASQATTVDHTQYLQSQHMSSQKTPVRKAPSREATKISPFVLRSSQLLTESQMFPASLMMDSMPMPPRWVDSDDENEDEDEAEADDDDDEDDELV